MSRRLLSPVLFTVIGLSLSGCGPGGGGLTPKPGHGMEIPDELWARHVQAFLEKDIVTLHTGYHAVIEEPTLMRFFNSSQDSEFWGVRTVEDLYADLFPRLTNDIKVHVQVLEAGHRDDYMVGTLVWSASSDGIRLVAETFVLSNVDQVWAIWDQGMYVDNSADGGQEIVTEGLSEDTPPVHVASNLDDWDAAFRRKDLDATVGSFSSTAQVRFYNALTDKETLYSGAAEVRGFYDEILKGVIPDQNQYWSSAPFRETDKDWSLSGRFSVAPKNQNFPACPIRVFATALADSATSKIERQVFVMWQWSENLNSAQLV